MKADLSVVEARTLPARALVDDLAHGTVVRQRVQLAAGGPTGWAMATSPTAGSAP